MVALILVNVTIFLLFNIIVSLIVYLGTFQYWKTFVLIYITLLITLFFLVQRVKNKFISLVLLILSSPIGILYIFGTIGIPFLILQVHLFFYLALCFISPVLLFYLYEFIGYPKTSIELKIYLILSSAVICSVVFHKQLKYVVHTFSPARFKTSEKLRPYNIEELSNYLLSENNIKLVVFVIYLIAIVFVNFYNFSDLTFYETANIDKAVLQSFVTYIAFDRIISSVKQVEFKPSEMVRKIRRSILNKIEQLENIIK